MKCCTKATGGLRGFPHNTPLPGGGPPVIFTVAAAFQLRQLLFLAQVVILRSRHCLAQDEAERLRLRAASITR